MFRQLFVIQGPEGRPCEAFISARLAPRELRAREARDWSRRASVWCRHGAVSETWSTSKRPPARQRRRGERTHDALDAYINKLLDDAGWQAGADVEELPGSPPRWRLSVKGFATLSGPNWRPACRQSRHPDRSIDPLATW